MSHAGAPSPLSLNSPSPAAGQASVAKNEPTSTEASKSHSARTAAIAGSIGGACALIVIVLVAVLFHADEDRRHAQEHDQIAEPDAAVRLVAGEDDGADDAGDDDEARDQAVDEDDAGHGGLPCLR